MTVDDETMLADLTAKELAAEDRHLHQASRRIRWALWGIAGGVMVYGLGRVTSLLLAYGAPPATAWLLSVMVDLGLCVSLWIDRVMARYGRRNGWVTALRWVGALTTWWLNTAETILPAHSPWVGFVIWSVGPWFLLVVVTAANQCDLIVASIRRDIGASITATRKPAQPVRRQPSPEPARPPSPQPAPDAEPTPTTAESAPVVMTATGLLRGMSREAAVPVLVRNLRDGVRLTWRDVQAGTDQSKSFCEKALAAARAEAARPHLVEAAR